MQIITGIIVVLISCCFPCYASTTHNQPIRVGLVIYPPFAQFKNNQYTGIAVDIWQEIADIEHLHYRYIPLNEDIKTAIELVKEHKLDVVVGPISTTFERGKSVDFSRPFFINMVGLAVPKAPQTPLDIFAIVAKSLVFVFGLIIIACVLFIYLLGLAERKFLSKDRGDEKSLYYIAWMYLISRRFLYLPVTLRGKFIALLGTGIIGFLVVTIVASISSSVTIALTYERDQFSDLGKLADKPIAAVEGTSHLEMSKQLGTMPVPAKDLAQAFSLLKKHKVEGVIGDHESLRYHIKKNKITNVHLADLILSYDELVFMLPLHSPLRKMIDQQILYLQDNGYTKMICERYIGLNAKYCSL